MKREFLQNLKVGDQPLTKEIIDAIMAENGRDIEAAKKPYADYGCLHFNASCMIPYNYGNCFGHG